MSERNKKSVQCVVVPPLPPQLSERLPNIFVFYAGYSSAFFRRKSKMRKKQSGDPVYQGGKIRGMPIMAWEYLLDVFQRIK